MARTPGRLSSTATSGHILEMIRTGSATSRSEIARATGLSRPSVALRITELIEGGLVTEGTRAASSGGRPPTLLEFNAASGLILTAALGMARSQAAVCDLDGRVLLRTPGSPQMEQGPDATVPWLLDTWSEQVRELGRSPRTSAASASACPARWSSTPDGRRTAPSSASGRAWLWARWSPSASPSR